MSNVQFPAVVTIQDLPIGTTPTGTELIEAVQTSLGVAASVKLSLSQILTAIPSTLATTAGLSVLGVASTASAIPSAITGTANQLLVVNNGGTGLAFGPINLSATAAYTGFLAGTAIATASIGAAQIATAAITSTQLATGAVTSTQIAAAAVGTAQMFTAAGLSVLAVASSGTTNFSVVTGTAGQVLAVNPAGTGVAFRGGMVLLNTLTPSGVASASDTTSLTSTFQNYLIVFDSIAPATQTTSFQMTVATSGTTFISGGYISVVSSVLSSENTTSFIALTGMTVTTSMQTTSTYGLSGELWLFNPSSTATFKHYTGQMTYIVPGSPGTATFNYANLGGIFNGTTSAVTGINFAFSSGNIATGVIKIFGVA